MRYSMRGYLSGIDYWGYLREYRLVSSPLEPNLYFGGGGTVRKETSRRGYDPDYQIA